MSLDRSIHYSNSQFKFQPPMADTGQTPSCHENKINNNPQVLNVLEALKKASHELQAHPYVHGLADSDSDSSSSIKALLELQTESDTILSSDPYLCNLSNLLSTLKSLVQTLWSSKGYDLRSFLTRRASAHSISRVAESIGSEIQAWIDREIVEELVNRLKETPGGDHNEEEEEVIKLLGRIEKRVSQGFDPDLQDLVLKSKLLARLDGAICDPCQSTRLREHAAFVIAALITFNKDVFVGQVLLGQTIRALIAISSASSLEVLILLIRSIKSAIVDEIESNGEIPKIISFLDCKDLQFRLTAMDCILEMGYFGRKEAIEAMLEAGLIKKLVELQQSSLGGALIDSSWYKDDLDHEGEDNKIGEGRRSRERKFLESHPFASCVARFAVQLEVGEGLRQRERRAFKQDILDRVRKASDTDAEAATIVAEVLWGSSP